ncbi:MAG TPA: YetF domain-containing protein [Acidimicrobiales bacterium]|nr:YetF domain-containing protein [Acidimicrobiales bacterium]
MTSVEITSSWSQIGFVLLSAGAMLTGIIIYVRIIGLRSFSKMSSFDFAVTVAMGSLLAAVTLSGSSLVDGLVGAGALLAVQAAIAYGRIRFGLSAVVDNQALLLMAGPTMLEENMRRARVTPDDLRAKLRQANIHRYDQVRYVVLETTGDVSVVQGDGELDPDVLADVVDAETLFTR